MKGGGRRMWREGEREWKKKSRGHRNVERKKREEERSKSSTISKQQSRWVLGAKQQTNSGINDAC